MKSNRRRFMSPPGLAGLTLTVTTSKSSGSRETVQGTRRQRFNMHGYRAPALDTVRVGLIGIGSRGSGTVRRLAGIEGVEIKALCDIVPERVARAIESIHQFPQHNPDSYTDGSEAWKALCDREDIDLIYIGTPWSLHTPMAVWSMERDKHAAIDRPAATSIEECWQLVETSEKTRKHCWVGTGSCHGRMAATALNMVRRGLFGEIIHGEGAYIHDRVSEANRWQRDAHGWFGYRPWRLDENIGRHGNLYSDSGVDSLSQMMNVNYGDKMDYLVSMSSNDFMMADIIRDLAEKDEYFKPYVGKDFRGNMNVTLIRTVKGRSMVIRHDTTSPRPRPNASMISGTKGIFMYGRNPRIAISHEGWLPEDELESLVERYTPEMSRRFADVAENASARERSGYSMVTEMDWRLIDCLRNGIPLEMNVYDAALWSAVGLLSEWSVVNRASVDVPDFTLGAWETNQPGMDIEFRNGGGTTRLI